MNGVLEQRGANKSFQRTLNTPRLFANACGILSQKVSPCPVSLNWALGQISLTACVDFGLLLRTAPTSALQLVAAGR
jgi:hypothetical protein